MKEVAETRYSFRFEPPPAAAALLDRARVYHEAGKHLLAVDGYHHPILHLLRQGVPVEMIVVEARDRPEKYLIWQSMADRVERAGADGLIFTTEAWVAKFDPSHPERHAIDAPDRAEALSTVGASAVDGVVEVRTPFGRDNQGQIVLGSTTEELEPQAFFLAPIRRYWSKLEK